VDVRVDRESGRWWVLVEGESRLAEGTLGLSVDTRLQSADHRIAFRFYADGKALSDPVVLVGHDSAVRVEVDPWTGAVNVVR
jgi:hypothetical protein